MDTPQSSVPGLPEPGPRVPAPAGGVSSGAWLGSQSVFDQRDERKLGRAFSVSLLIHLGLLAMILVVFAVRPDVANELQNQVIKMVYMQTPGPGGGGGGSPAPAPPKPVAIPPHATPVPIPVPTPVIPPPMLNAPVMTAADAMQATGASSVSLAAYGGGGSGGGIGSGTGNGVGPGTGGGFGGGAYHPGNGITTPQPIKTPAPQYTADAMRAKVQGTVEVDAVVQPDGTVSDVRVSKSLDQVYGLDQEALKAAKRWLFKPGLDRTGKPVPVLIRIALDFTIH